METEQFKQSLSAILSNEYSSADIKIIKKQLKMLEEKESKAKKQMEKEKNNYIKKKKSAEKELNKIKADIKSLKNILISFN